MAWALTFSCMTCGANANVTVHDLWTGPYLGVYMNGGSGNGDTTYQASTTTTFIQGRNNVITGTNVTQTNFAGTLKGNLSGAMADLLVGYNVQPNNTRFLLGAQLEGSFFSDLTSKASGAVSTSISQSVISQFLGSRGPVTLSTTSTQTARNSLSSILSLIKSVYCCKVL